MNYTLIRTNRKTVAIQIKGDSVIVRATLKMSQQKIDDFVNAHLDWIKKHLTVKTDVIPITEEELIRLTARAEEYLSERVEHYARLLGVTYSKITVRHQRTRWGSCSSKGNLSFNCLLMLAPIEVIDSVVVHEVCHLKEMNHSKRFYANVLKLYPQYYVHHAWLKKEGRQLMMRLDKK